MVGRLPVIHHAERCTAPITAASGGAVEDQRDVVEEKPRLGITAGRTLVSALHAVHLEGWGDRNFTGPIQAHPSGIDANTSGICT